MKRPRNIKVRIRTCTKITLRPPRKDHITVKVSGNLLWMLKLALDRRGRCNEKVVGVHIITLACPTRSSGVFS
jgi:hypothetical protein